MAGGSIDPGTGGGNSNTIEICGDIYWNAGSGVLTGPTCFPCQPLPIELILFKGTPIDNKVKLEWTTLTEKNNESYIVERSLDALSFEEIGSIPGSGNSYTLKDYSIYDKNPLRNIAYYRLKQIDFDKSYSYSDIISVKRNGSHDIKVFPNPFSNQIIIEMDSDKNNVIDSVFIIDARGVQLKNLTTDTSETSNNILLNVKDLSTGIYIMQINLSSSEIIRRKIIKN